MASGTVGNITWNLDESTGLMTVSGSGAIPDYSSGGTPWNAYLDDIQDVVIDDGITVIGTYAFDSCEYLISVSMGDTVTTIKDYAFRYCYALEKIKLSASLTTIEDFTFYKDENLTGVVFPASVTSIGTFAFNGCDNLTDIRFEGDQPTLGSSSFNVGGSSAVIQTNGWGSDDVFTTTVRGSSTTFTYKALQPSKGVHIKVNGEWVSVNADVYAKLNEKQDILTIDDALDGASTNPLQNKVVNQSIYNLSVQLGNEIDGKQDKLPAGTEGQVWTAGSDGTGSWQTPAKILKFIKCNSIVSITTENTFTSTTGYSYGNPTSGGDSIVFTEDMLIGYTQYSVTANKGSVAFYNGSLTTNDLFAIVTSILGISDFTDFPDCTLTIKAYKGMSSTGFVSSTNIIEAVISGGTATFSCTGNVLCAKNKAYFAVQSISVS